MRRFVAATRRLVRRAVEIAQWRSLIRWVARMAAAREHLSAREPSTVERA